MVMKNSDSPVPFFTMHRAPFANSLSDAPVSPRSGKARGSASYANVSSSIFDTSNPPAAPPSRRGAAPHQDTWAPTATYGAPIDGPRPRIVNGKIVKGDDLRNVPAANGPPSPQNSTGLTWAPSPPVIRRRAADEAMVSAVAPPPHYPAAAPAAASQHYHQQQQQYEGDREAHHHYAPHGEDLGGVGGGGGGGGGGWRGSGGGGGGGGGEESYHHPAPQAYQPTHAAQQQQHQQQPPVSSARSTGISHSSNAFASGSNQNCGNVLTDRPTSRVLAPPGGRSSISLF